MYFKFACPSCGKNLKVREEDGGRKARCPYCKTHVTVPKFEPSAVPEAKPRTKPSESEALAAAAAQARPGGAPAPPRKPAEEPGLGDATEGGFSQAGFDATNVPIIPTAAIGLAGTALFYAALIPIWNTDVAEKFWDRGAVTYATVFLTAWSFAILALKWRKMRRQKDAMLFDLLPTEISDEITVRDVPKFTKHIRTLPAEAGNSFLINRVLRGLEYFRVRRNNPEAAALLNSQSDIDANAVYSSYAMVKIFTWAIPILGFIGTVIGISEAVGGLGGDMGGEDMEALKAALGEVTGGLGKAFDTTLVALVFSLLVAIPTTVLRKSEEDLLNSVDEYCNENLLKRLNDDEGQVDAASGTSAIRKAIEQSMAAHHAELETWTKKLESIGSTMTDEAVKGWSKVFTEIDQTQQSQSKAQREQMEALQKAIVKITERTDAAEKQAAESMRETAASMRGYFDAMAEGIGGLNRVLGDLGEKQVVIQGGKRGWWPFGRSNGR